MCIRDRIAPVVKCTSGAISFVEYPFIFSRTICSVRLSTEMCIRDSNNTMLIAMQRPDATLVTSYKNWQSMGRPVSYTHLDVYKRQVVTSGYCNCRICCGVWSGGPTASGAHPTANHTIAVDASNPFVPIGTKVVMIGVEYTVEDLSLIHIYHSLFQ